MTSAYRSETTLRLTFSVGVSSHDATVKSCGRMRHLRISVFRQCTQPMSAQYSIFETGTWILSARSLGHHSCFPNCAADRWSGVSETLLMYAARRDHIERVIRPALERGAWVVCDRFADSTRAYQGAGEAVDPVLIGALEAHVLEGAVFVVSLAIVWLGIVVAG